jgi:multidrug efflux system outer membrane protein
MKLPNILYVSVALLFILESCKVSKNIATPTDTTPQAFRGVAKVDSSSIASLKIAEFFKDQTILQLIDTALIRNLDVQVALKNIESAELLFKQSKLGNLPIVNLQLSASSNRPSDNSLNGLSTSQFLGTKHIEDYNAVLGLSWEADIWSKIKSQKQAALATYLQTSEAKKALQTRIVANVAQGYYQLLMMDAQMGVARRNLALNDSTLSMIKLQFDAGQVTSLAIQQAEAQRLVAAGIIPQLEQAIALQENALSILTGKIPGAIARASKLEDLTMPERLAVGIPSEMVATRPDVRVAELALQVANARVGVTKANMYPSLTITATGGLNSLKASNWFTLPASLFGTVAGGIAQPLFQRKQLRTQYNLSLVDRERVVIQFRQSVLTALGEVSDELVKIDKLQEQYNFSKQRVLTLQTAVKNANLLFKNGMATYLEVITAQSNSLQSELELAAVKAAELTAAVELYRALGGGIQ